ncbi:DinB family protein [Alicyclobacillus fastidiosus]|uniref:DinB family protein n=1 Tax=Alicyclobacillus fastidiosus TaxID=392011 RepID=A0ABV5ALF4_9BACL|nr:DinB family protein [Alicyclobacillus fastidiosus]WEH09392.1 DinB family protein [Alicyclobacillus fastidiosus]
MTKAQAFLQQWMIHRRVLPDLFAALNDEDLLFRPWDGAMSTADLAVHILSSGLSFGKLAATGKYEPSAEKPQLNTIADVQQAYHKYTTELTEIINAISDEQFDTTVSMFGREVTAGTVLATMRDHEIHHKGQLFVYARLCSAQKVPMFINAG